MIQGHDLGKGLLSVPVLGVMLLTANPAFADWDHRGKHDRHSYRHHRHHGHHHGHHHRHYYGRSSVVLPRNSISISWDGFHFHYGDGRFYKRRAHDYVIVRPPRGVIVYTLPAGCRTRLIGGTSYYVYEGVYYRKSGRGYQVVEPPEDDAPQYVAAAVASSKPQDAFTINIPNSNGGYTAVTLKKSGSGYLGPQGEYYADFPKVEQLREMYSE